MENVKHQTVVFLHPVAYLFYFAVTVNVQKNLLFYRVKNINNFLYGLSTLYILPDVSVLYILSFCQKSFNFYNFDSLYFSLD